MEPLSFRPNVSSLWERNSTCGAFGRSLHIAAPDVCDGTSAVGESRHRIPGASVGQPTEPCRPPAALHRTAVVRQYLADIALG